MRLSPLNLRGLLTAQGLLIAGAPTAHAAGANGKAPRPREVTMFRCGTCNDLHDEYEEAEDCCAPLAASGLPVRDDNPNACPVCAAEYGNTREATNCCLWKDIDAPTRYALADRVEGGATWPEALGIALGQPT